MDLGDITLCDDQHNSQSLNTCENNTAQMQLAPDDNDNNGKHANTSFSQITDANNPPQQGCAQVPIQNQPVSHTEITGAKHVRQVNVLVPPEYDDDEKVVSSNSHNKSSSMVDKEKLQAPPTPPPPPPITTAPLTIAPPESATSNNNTDRSVIAGRLSAALLKITKTRLDSPSMRLWEMFVLVVVSTAYMRFTLEVSQTWTKYAEAYIGGSVLSFLVSFVFILDEVIKLKFLHPLDRKKFTRKSHMMNVLTAIPYDVIVLALGSNHTTYGLRAFLSAVPALRVLTIPWMFHSDSPDFVDVLYIRFYFQWVPKMRLVVYTLLMMHTLAVLHVLALNTDDGDYPMSLMWVWVLLTSAPLSVTVENDYEACLAGLLMLLSMLIQGYAVSAVSSIVLGFDIQQENRNHMLVTLEMLRYYKVPRELQEEVLSFQYHVLQDSSMQTHFAPELQRLPPNMLNEIQLCASIGVLDKAAFFDLASKECKAALAKAMVQVLADPMTDIIRAGDIGKSMYFMMHGLADVTLMNGLVVATLRRGDFFGEMALLNTDARRMATVCSLTYCDVLELLKVDFDEALTNYVEFRNVIEEKRRVLTLLAPAPKPSPKLQPSDDRHQTTNNSPPIVIVESDHSQESTKSPPQKPIANVSSFVSMPGFGVKVVSMDTSESNQSKYTDDASAHDGLDASRLEGVIGGHRSAAASMVSDTHKSFVNVSKQTPHTLFTSVGSNLKGDTTTTSTGLTRNLSLFPPRSIGPPPPLTLPRTISQQQQQQQQLDQLLLHESGVMCPSSSALLAEHNILVGERIASLETKLMYAVDKLFAEFAELRQQVKDGKDRRTSDSSSTVLKLPEWAPNTSVGSAFGNGSEVTSDKKSAGSKLSN